MELSLLIYDCGCIIRLTMKRELFTATLCNGHEKSVRLTESIHKSKSQNFTRGIGK